MKTNQRLLMQRFRRQHGVMSRSELRAEGVTAAQERAAVARGEWERPTRRVVRNAGSAITPEQGLMIALLEMGPTAIVSHQSAAWLWRLVGPPARHAVTVGLDTAWRSGAFDLHRLSGSPPAISMRGQFPTTNPLRTLVDLAGVVPPAELDDAVDRAIALKLVTVTGLQAEVGRLSRQGRKGTGALRRGLVRRGLAEGPHPSVLEARFHRLLDIGGLRAEAVEVVAGEDGQFRIDARLDGTVHVEVDGHSFHSTPEQKAADDRRRNELRMAGIFLLVYSWQDVLKDGRRIIAEMHQALARFGSGRRLAN